MKKVFLFLALFSIVLALPAYAAVVNVDLSGASTSNFIDGGGADFATAFQGQVYDGSYGLSGSPSGLTLNPINTLEVAFWSGSNSILPTPGNMGPLSILLESSADSITWTMGYANPPSSVTIDFYGASGSLVYHTVQSLIEGYNVYSYNGFGSFKGISIYSDNDAAGLHFQNFSYNSATCQAPEPATMLLLGLGLVGIAGFKRKMK